MIILLHPSSTSFWATSTFSMAASTRDRRAPGDLEIEAPEHADAHDTPAVGYVRPYDIEVERHRNGAQAIEAIVSRLQRVGPLVHLELTRGDTGDLIEVELSKERYREMHLKAGERVFITPRKLKVFVQDT